MHDNADASETEQAAFQEGRGVGPDLSQTVSLSTSRVQRWDGRIQIS